ncbi:MAG: ABC transporter substrate-binding protein [Ilumatobacteraceae bacterium]
MKNPLLTRRVAILAAASLVFLAACGGGDGPPGTTDSPDTTAGVCSGAGKKVLSLSPTATEMVYAIGAGDQVVAVDSLSNWPAEAADKVTKISAFEPNAEEILGYDPDIVLISNDMNSITAQLQSVKPALEVWTGAAPTAIGDVYTQIDALGAMLCRESEAAALIDGMDADINEALSGVVAPEGASYFYELDNTLYSVTSATFVGSLLASTGIANIADGVEEGNNYPQMNAESIISADPSIIFLADVKCCGQNIAEVSKRPGWSAIDAVRNGRVWEIDDDVASRWGPRIVELVQIMASAVQELGS